MPSVAGELRENQCGHWEDSCDAKRSTYASPNRSQICATVWRFRICSPGLSFCLDRKLAARFKTPGRWTALRERNLSWDQRRRRAQACPGCATVNPLGVLCGIPPPCCLSWLAHDTSEGGESEPVPGRRFWAPGSLFARIGSRVGVLVQDDGERGTGLKSGRCGARTL